MKMSISNIAWDKTEDLKMYRQLSINGFSGIEIAPTRLWPENPYEQLKEASDFKDWLLESFQLEISSLQSIWFGRTEKMFESLVELDILKNYTKKAIDFSEVLGCRNLVFGCPKNRCIMCEKNIETAFIFFYEMGEYAAKKNTVFSIEPNPSIYGTNFINTTDEALEIAKKVCSSGFKINLDIGTVIYNEENLNTLRESIAFINHVHISEPYLASLKARELHTELYQLLKNQYKHYISIEMKNPGKTEIVLEAMQYIKEIFYE